MPPMGLAQQLELRDKERKKGQAYACFPFLWRLSVTSGVFSAFIFKETIVQCVSDSVSGKTKMSFNGLASHWF